jgi:hypothetical protein
MSYLLTKPRNWRFLATWASFFTEGEEEEANEKKNEEEEEGDHEVK